jgi:hypothetical protein
MFPQLPRSGSLQPKAGDTTMKILREIGLAALIVIGMVIAGTFMASLREIGHSCGGIEQYEIGRCRP